MENIQKSNSSILLKGDHHTSFIFQILFAEDELPNVEKINIINSKRNIGERVREIDKLDAQIKFVITEKSVFRNNLLLVDSLMPNILSKLILLCYTKKMSTLKTLVDYMEAENPLGYNTKYGHTFYDYKIKKFLLALLCGLTSKDVWHGLNNIKSEHFLIRKNVNTLSYPIFNLNQYEDFLLQNTKLEIPMITSQDIGKIYTSGGKYFIKLNLQIKYI